MGGFGEVLSGGELRVVEEGGEDVAVLSADFDHFFFDLLSEG